eukprot:2099695-Amphidinium_carterae.1
MANARLAHRGLTRGKLLKACDTLAEALPCPRGVREAFLSSLARSGIHSWSAAGSAHDGDPTAANAVGRNPITDALGRGTYA